MIIFSIIAIFILVIACINYMNMSTARSANRAKEVGIKKSLGSNRNYLIIQFLAESILVALSALILALVLIKLFLPAFNTLIGKQLAIDYFNNVRTIPLMIKKNSEKTIYMSETLDKSRYFFLFLIFMVNKFIS